MTFPLSLCREMRKVPRSLTSDLDFYVLRRMYFLVCISVTMLSLHLSISPSFSFSFNHVTIASLVSLVAHSPRPDMLSSLLLTLQLYNGHGHGTLNGRGYDTACSLHCNCFACYSLSILHWYCRSREFHCYFHRITIYCLSVCNSSCNAWATLNAKEGSLISTSSSSTDTANHSSLPSAFLL